MVAAGRIALETLTAGPGYGDFLWWSDSETVRQMDQALAKRTGPIVPLLRGLPATACERHERDVCVDTTASGGKAALLGASA